MSDTITLAIAGGVTLLTSLVVLRAAGPHAPGKQDEHAGTVKEVAEERPAPGVPPSPGSTRPRILTGEPAAPETRRPASRRALKLVGGITLLAAAGAFGLLAVVRALISLFDRIG
jgi:hypothetical protein